MKRTIRSSISIILALVFIFAFVSCNKSEATGVWENATYLDTFGWIVHLLGRPMEAKPFFKKAMLHGGKDSAVIMDHYAEVLFALKEYDLAFVYWNLAKSKNAAGDVEGLEEKISIRRKEAGR